MTAAPGCSFSHLCLLHVPSLCYSLSLLGARKPYTWEQPATPLFFRDQLTEGLCGLLNFSRGGGQITRLNRKALKKNSCIIILIILVHTRIQGAIPFLLPWLLLSTYWYWWLHFSQGKSSFIFLSLLPPFSTLAPQRVPSYLNMLTGSEWSQLTSWCCARATSSPEQKQPPPYQPPQPKEGHKLCALSTTLLRSPRFKFQLHHITCDLGQVVYPLCALVSSPEKCNINRTYHVVLLGGLNRIRHLK